MSNKRAPKKTERTVTKDGVRYTLRDAKYTDQEVGDVPISDMSKMLEMVNEAIYQPDRLSRQVAAPARREYLIGIAKNRFIRLCEAFDVEIDHRTFLARQ